MPYIDQTARIHIKKESKRRVLDSMGRILADTGELSYVIMRILLTYMGDTLTETKINEVVGVLERIKLEFYRRLCAPFEEIKKEENGDIF